MFKLFLKFLILSLSILGFNACSKSKNYNDKTNYCSQDYIDKYNNVIIAYKAYSSSQNSTVKELSSNELNILMSTLDGACKSFLTNYSGISCLASFQGNPTTLTQTNVKIYCQN